MKKLFTLFLVAISFSLQAQTFERVSDINTSGDGDAQSLVEFAGKIFFVSNDGVNGDGIYYTDGTLAGTQLLINVAIYTQGGEHPAFLECNGKLFFIADDGTHGNELWVTDGTTNGTMMVKDINTGMPNSISTAMDIEKACFNNKLYFYANDGVNGEELWVSDGTINGTTLLKDINSGSSSSLFYGTSFAALNNTLYFFADDGVNGKELWKTDGTTNGTALFNNYTFQYNEYAKCMIFNNKLWFTSASTQSDYDIYVSDGTVGGTASLSSTANIFGTQSWFESYEGNFVSVNNKLLVEAIGLGFYLTDGTLAGTLQIPIDADAIRDAISVNGKLFLDAIKYSPVATSIYVTDGTQPNTVLLTPTSGSGSANFKEINGTVCFLSSIGNFGREPWVTDGTVNGTFRLRDTNPGSGDGVDPSGSWSGKIYNNKFYYNQDWGNNLDSILWVTDGTTAGTVRVWHPVTTNYIDFSGDDGIVFNNCLFMIAQFDNAGHELWKYCDGSVGINHEEEEALFNLFPNPNNGSFIISLNSETAIGSATLEIYNISGQLIQSEQINNQSNTLRKQIDLTVAKGIYTVRLTTNGNVYSHKLVIK